MNKKNLPIILSLVIIAGLAAGLIFFHSDKTTNSSSPPQKISNSSPTAGGANSSSRPAQSAEKFFTSIEVAKHNSGGSCFAAIRGSVYDLTGWINQHPGGPENILGICGTDATAQFNSQHQGQRKPENLLAQFKIGVLKN